jgi:hypothetical protein
MTQTTTPQRFAAAAPYKPDSDATPEPCAPEDHNLHALFEAWSHWSRTRRYYAPPPSTGTILGKLSGKSRPFTGAPDAACNADLAALHLAILGQPRDALDTLVFYAYYGERRSNIKRTADEIGISRVHFYRLLKAFCTRVRAVSQDISSSNLMARSGLPHWRD